MFIAALLGIVAYLLVQITETILLRNRPHGVNGSRS
jgi:hypothetical protein